MLNYLYLQDIVDDLINIAKEMTFFDYMDIFLLTLITYWVIKLVRETRAIQLIKGIAVLFIIVILVRQFEFKALGLLSEALMNVGMTAMIVMFQPELRRMLEKVGRTNVVKSIADTFENNPNDINSRIALANDQIASASEKLSRTKTGALIVIERKTKLGEQIDTGVILNAEPTEALFENIFFPNTPMHDGAVIVRGGSILAAGCFLPKPQKEDLVEKQLGSRHRAAIGMSEVSDALVVVVSEETGTISVAEDGELKRGFDKFSLLEFLNSKLIPEKNDSILRKEMKLKRSEGKQKDKIEPSDFTNTNNPEESVND